MATCPDSEEVLGELGTVAFATPWPLAVPREKSKVLTDRAQLYPLIMQPHDVLEMRGFLCVVGEISGHLRQETILLGHGYPRQGKLAKLKVEVFRGWQSHLGTPSSLAPCVPPKRSPAQSDPTSPPHSHKSG